MIAFGPVPSRRLGRSLGINNIPPKNCTYTCVYCQVGRTHQMQVERRSFYAPKATVARVRSKVATVREAGEPIDYLAFVPDGEPTLDRHLGQVIELLKPLALPIAVITNASLIWQKDVRQDLICADWVSLKIDAVDEGIWRRVDRPHGRLDLALILEGAFEFARDYRGRLVTETMLVAGVNDSPGHLRALGHHLERLEPSIAYVSVPTRPPAEDWVRAPGEATINQAYQILSESVKPVEYLVGYEGNAFALTGEVEDDLLSITAVHPMREDAVSDLLARAGAGWVAVDRLLASDQLVKTRYQGHTFYLRRPAGPHPAPSGVPLSRAGDHPAQTPS